MKKIENAVAIAVEKWENSILDFLKELYTDKWLPSHDISHHKRVWKNAVALCNLMADISDEDVAFYDKLILGCYFHDVGLLTDPGEYHGKESRKICEGFLEKYKSAVNFNTDDLFFAIENHDEKNNYSKIKSSDRLLEILTLADDLDAFGAIGTYRYIEIYLIRKIPVEKIAERILDNAFQRFENIVKILSKYGVKNTQFENKYLILKSLLNADLYNDKPVNLILWINEKIVKPKENPFMIIGQKNHNGVISGRIQNFIEKFNTETKAF